MGHAKMKFSRTGISTTAVAAIAVVVIIVVGAGAYLAASGSKTTTTVTSTSTTTSLSTTTTVSTSVSTSTSTSTTTATTTTGAPATLTGAGSTLVTPLMSSWTFAYQQYTGNVKVNYQSVGSGAGVTDLTQKIVDFGASDAPPSSAQYSAFPAQVVVIPESASAVVPAYNLPGITNGLKFTGAVLAGIFMGNITMWNDPAIAALNPTATLPAHAITVVHRSDASGTMFAFTNFLSDSSAAWKTKIGTATLPNWPVGLGCKGNEGVAGCIENTQYAIGPLEIAYAIVNPSLISYGAVANGAGNYVLANLTNVAAAVAAGASGPLPAGNGVWSSVSIINNIFNDTTHSTVYPITTFTYVVVYQIQASQTQGTALVNFLWWVVNNAQSAGTSIGYVPLPSNVVSLDDATIKTITYNGTPLLVGP